MPFCPGNEGFQTNAFDWDAFQEFWESAFEAQAFQNDSFQLCISEANIVLNATEAPDTVSFAMTGPALEIVGVGIGGAPPRLMARKHLLREEEEIMLIISEFLYLEAA